MLPDEFFKKRLHQDRQSGLYPHTLAYRQQNVDHSDLKVYLDKMSEKIDTLLENVVPLGNTWTPKVKMVPKTGNQMAGKVLFDDIHFGKDVLSDARKIPSLDINKICERFMKLDIQDQNFPQDYLNFYVNQGVAARTAEKGAQREQINIGQRRVKGYQTQSPQTLQNDTLKSE